jgi:hypothetical protein
MDSKVIIRSYAPNDRGKVFGLLAFLPNLYPGASEWLERRLNDVEASKANCTVISQGRLVAGVLIDAPKGRRLVKLSNIYIAPHLHRASLGQRLYNFHSKLWWRESDCAYVTVAQGRLPHIRNFLLRNSYRQIGFENNRYGDGRHEYIFANQFS